MFHCGARDPVHPFMTRVGAIKFKMTPVFKWCSSLLITFDMFVLNKTWVCEMFKLLHSVFIYVLYIVLTLLTKSKQNNWCKSALISNNDIISVTKLSLADLFLYFSVLKRQTVRTW